MLKSGFSGEKRTEYAIFARFKTINMENIKLSELEINTGQLDGLPRNPRFIRDEKYAALKRNIQDYPEMLGYRGLLVSPLPNGHYIIIGGNMRYRAMRELGYEEAPCAVVPEGTPVETLRAYAILDNNAFGQWDWDLIANEWDMQDIGSWGVDTPIDFEEEDGDADSGDAADHPSASLADTFLIPPMSVIQTAGDAWKERAAWWRERSHADDADRLVLIDIILRWFTPMPRPAVLSPLDDDPAIRTVTETAGGTYTTGASIPTGTQDIIIADISGQPTAVADTLAQTAVSLRPCRFAVIIDAYETPTASDTVKDAFAARDTHLLNELVIIEPTDGGMDDYTKVYVFYNDDPRRVSKLYPKVEGVDAATGRLEAEEEQNG